MRTLGVTIDIVIGLIIVLAFAIKFYGFQTYLAQILAGYMSGELNAKVSIERVEIDLLKRVELKGLLVKDLRNDTILYAPSMKCVLQNYSVRKRYIQLNEITLTGPRIKIAKYKGEKDLNFQFIADYFDDGPSDPNKKSKPWKISCSRIKVKGGNFSMDNFNKTYSKFGVDFDHLGLFPLNVNLSEFKNYGDTTSLTIRNLSLIEKSGFILDTLNSKLKVTPSSLTFSPLRMKTPYSVIKSPYLTFSFNDFEDFDDFEAKVRMSSFISATTLNLGDLSYFAHELQGADQNILLNGKFEGTVDDFEATRFTFGYTPNTMIIGDFRIKDITHIKKAYFDLQIKKLKASQKDLAQFKIPPYGKEDYLDLPDEVRNLGDIDYVGKFKGTLDEFSTSGNLLSSIGSATTDLNYKVNPETKQYAVNGKINLREFNVGTLLDDNSLGKMTSTIDLTASGRDFKKTMNVNVKADVQSLVYNDYAYHNTIVNGKIRNETFIGNFKIRDPNISLDYDGYFDYGRRVKGKMVPVYDFTATVSNAYITRLNFGNRDESAKVSFEIRTTGQGINPDDLRGTVNVRDIVFVEKDVAYDFNNLRIKAEELTDSTKKLSLKSEVATVNIEGIFNFKELPNVFVGILSKAVPSMFDNRVVKVDSYEKFEYKIEILDFTKIQKLFIPELELSRNIVFDGRFDSRQDIFKFQGKNIARLKYGDQYLEDLKIISKNNGDFLSTDIKAQNFFINDSIQLQNFRLEMQAFNNNTESHITWKNKPTGNSGDLTVLGTIVSHDNFNFTLQPSEIKIAQGTWKNENPAKIEIDSTTIRVSDFDARNGAQSISIDGVISKSEQDQLVASLCNFKLETITPLLIGQDLSFKGDVNGNIVLGNVYTRPDFVNSIAIDSFFVNNQWVGDFSATNYYEKGSDRVVTVGELSRKGIPSLDVKGNYYLDRKENNFDYRILFKGTNLAFLNGFLPPDIVSNFQSLADGEIKLTGSPDEPQFNGKLKIHNGSIKVTMLNTSYFLENGEIEVMPDMIALNKLTIQDVRGNGGTVNGTYNHKNFTNGDYAFDLNFNKMLCLNTTEDMNEIYYGKAYASGTASIQGYGDKIDVVIDAKTEKNTKLTMPMYGVGDVTVGDFVIFESDKDTSNSEKKINLDGITMTFDFRVTPEAEINIVFDKLSGAQLKARGAGDIKMEITPLGDFLMNGTYEVDNPSTYKLAMQSIINKNFIVAKGGTIKWYGDPLNAEIDITAVYPVKASVFDIMPVDIQSSYRKNMDVKVEIQLKNSLFKPDFVFDINIPKADENVRAALASVKSTNQELFRQSMSLLLINKFLTPANAIGTTAANTGASSAANYSSELLTNQLNSLLSQISKDYDIGINYKPGDEITGTEVALALSTQTLNGRLNISTNVGVSSSAAAAANQSQNSLIGDFNIEYLLTEDGNIRVRGYNESNAFDITNSQQAPYTQGMAIFYQKDFDNSKQLRMLQKFLNIFRPASRDWKDTARKKKSRKERKKEREEPIDVEPDSTVPDEMLNGSN
ncbi:MAG TPA: translocation/assembly module TamB domain-containing protein [Flavobacteriales bacterium]|nr:translocation/assembly module TamB domain-containing protein [Flavobacteriales bacterium]